MIKSYRILDVFFFFTNVIKTAYEYSTPGFGLLGFSLIINALKYMPDQEIYMDIMNVWELDVLSKFVLFAT